jgi:hypothetical protein
MDGMVVKEKKILALVFAQLPSQAEEIRKRTFLSYFSSKKKRAIWR